jgi:hypothetical protein
MTSLMSSCNRGTAGTDAGTSETGLTLNKGSPQMPKADTEHTTARDTGRTRPDAITTPRRRGLLTGTLAALLTGTAAVATAKAASLMPPPGDDAELLTVAQDFWKQDAIVAQWNADQVTEEIGEAAHDRWWECLEEISAILPTTDFGLRAKADCLLQGLEVVETSNGIAEDYVRDFLADLAGREAA